MDYEKKLKEALCSENTDYEVVQWIERNFPELKESGDERIRKWLIDYLNNRVLNLPPGAVKEAVSKSIAWLEKQGEPTEINPSEFDSQLNRLLKQFESLSKEELASSLSFYLNVIQNDGTYKSDEKQGEQKYTQRDIDDAYLKGIADAKREVEKIDEQTEKMKKEIAEFIFNSKEDIKQRHEWIKCLGFDVKFSNEEKYGEQKPADKVEPKFHEGDWVVSLNGVYWHIDAIRDGRYQVSSNSGECTDWSLDTNIYHKFTIQDAKDGDVLSYRNGQWCFIYKGIVTEDTFKYYALLSEKGIVINDAAFSLLSSCITPATKEQRDTLLKAMTDAGYTFNFEKKKLKKIEQKPTEDVDLPEFESYLCLMFQKFRTKGMCTNGEIIEYVKEQSQKLRDILVKPAWSEEELDSITAAINNLEYLKNNYVYHPMGLEPAITFLKSLKERVQPQPKQEWSEEDEQTFIKAVEALEDFGKFELADWLKEHKNQSLRPRLQWKPSDEQMKCLSDVLGTDDHTGYVLNTLYNDLKKLREE